MNFSALNVKFMIAKGMEFQWFSIYIFFDFKNSLDK